MFRVRSSHPRLSLLCLHLVNMPLTREAGRDGFAGYRSWFLGGIAGYRRVSQGIAGYRRCLRLVTAEAGGAVMCTWHTFYNTFKLCAGTRLSSLVSALGYRSGTAKPYIILRSAQTHPKLHETKIVEFYGRLACRILREQRSCPGVGVGRCDFAKTLPARKTS